MNEKLFQQQKYDRNFIHTNPFNINEKYIDYNGIISVNTFVPLSKVLKNELYTENINFFVEEAEDYEKMHPKKNTTMTQQIMKNNENTAMGLKKKINQKQKNSKPMRLNYNSLTNVIPGAMAKHAGDEDENFSIPDDI